MTGADHQHNAETELAAQWLAEQNPPPASPIPELRRRFNLTALEACESCALAQKFRIVRSFAA